MVIPTVLFPTAANAMDTFFGEEHIIWTHADKATFMEKHILKVKSTENLSTL